VLKTALVFVLVAGGIVGYLAWQKSRPQPFIVSGYVEADEIRVGSRIGGRVANVYVEEGDTTKKGDSIYDLDPFDLREELARAGAQAAAAKAEHDRFKTGFRPEEIEQARARRDLAHATLDKLVAGPRPQEIAIAREELNVAKATLDLAESEYARLERLRESQQAAPTEFDAAVRARKEALANVARAEQRVALLEEGTRKEEIAEAKAHLAEAEEAVKLVEAGYRAEDVAQAEARLQAARAQTDSIKVQIAELAVLSPCDCVVEAIDLRPGDLVAENAPGTALLDLSRTWVRAYVPESRIGQIKLDQRVPLRIISMSDQTLTGRISFIAREAEFTPRNVQTPEERSKQVFRIKVRLEAGQTAPRVGMSADLLIDESAPPS